MGSGASKDGNQQTNNGRPVPAGRAARPEANRYLDREQRPRNTHDDLFSTDLFHNDTEIRPIDELRSTEGYPQVDQREPITERLNDVHDDRNQRRDNVAGPERALQRNQPVGHVDRWMGQDPWLGRDGWPAEHSNQNIHGQPHAPRLHPGYQVIRPPRYEDVVQHRQPAPRPEPEQLNERQTEQVPVLLTNQNQRIQPHLRPNYDDDTARNSRLAGDNLQDVEVQSLLSYGKGGEKDVTVKGNIKSDKKEEKIEENPIDDIQHKQVDSTKVKVFKEDDDEYIGANLRFYRNEIKFRPNGEYIDNIHKYWYGDYRRLEKSQTYIQWLFPLSELSSVNPYALPLQKHEAKYIKDDDETYGRVVTSYQMMLDFFGMSLADPNTGKVARSDMWMERYSHLKRSGKNYFRITRIIRSLGALGMYLYQAPFVMFLLHEVLETKELAAVPPGIVNTWLGAIDNAFDREYIRKQFQQPLNDMNNLYEKKNVKIRVQDNSYYESVNPSNDDSTNRYHRQRDRRSTGPSVPPIEE